MSPPHAAAKVPALLSALVPAPIEFISYVLRTVAHVYCEQLLVARLTQKCPTNLNKVVSHVLWKFLFNLRVFIKELPQQEE